MGVSGCSGTVGIIPAKVSQSSSATSILSLESNAVSFGDVEVNTVATQTLTLTSTGTAAVTINTATLTGSGFALEGGTFPLTLNAGQSTALVLQFDPASGEAVTGQLTISSNAQTGATQVVALSGDGTLPQVDLVWDAPADLSDSISAYEIFRAPAGSSDFQLLNSQDASGTTYADNTVQSGQAYDYFVESMDDSGITSEPSNIFTVTVP
ncbi:MAG: choice-of-anchor D domain-containing protein [Terracidiphilus sp.]